jgi:hypothetical protein
MKDKYDLGMLRKKPKRKNSRSKGNAFERKICSMLNHRFKSAEFSRSPGSGAFATSHTLPAHLQIYGDLITPLNFKYCIECKKGYNNLNLYSLYNDSSEIWKFIEQSEKDSEKCSKIPMVIFKQDRQPILAILPKGATEGFEDNLKHIDIHKNKTYRVYLFNELLTCWDSIWFA